MDTGQVNMMVQLASIIRSLESIVTAKVIQYLQMPITC
jgi:hypothetical protein